MSDERPTRAAAVRPSADLTGRDPSRTLAGLIDVLDRADGPMGRRRVHPRHAAAARAAAYRSGAGRPVPLRSMRVAPPAVSALPARPALPALSAPSAVPASPPGAASSPPPVVPRGARPGALARLTRRVALWGAGPGGEHLAWHRTASIAPVGAPPSVVAPPAPPVERRRAPAARGGLLAGLRRSVALWGAGPGGEHLAWGAGPLPRPAPVHDRPAVDGPVVLRELPSTPTVQPATSSPVAALVPGSASSPAGPVAPSALLGHRPPAPPVADRKPAGPRVPVQFPRTPQPTGWPRRPPRSSHRPARSFPMATGLARARGDPSSCRARGSPRPPPCRALPAPG